MANEMLEAKFKRIVDATAKVLKPIGYKKSSTVFRCFRDGNCGLVSFQRSTSSNYDYIKFTLNLAVACGDVFPEYGFGEPIEKVTFDSANLNQRIGFLRREPEDYWWELVDATDAEPIAQEIAELVLSKGISWIDARLSTSAMLAIWKAGKGGHCRRALEIYRSKRGDLPDSEGKETD